MARRRVPAAPVLPVPDDRAEAIVADLRPVLDDERDITPADCALLEELHGIDHFRHLTLTLCLLPSLAAHEYQAWRHLKKGLRREPHRGAGFISKELKPDLPGSARRNGRPAICEKRTTT